MQEKYSNSALRKLFIIHIYIVLYINSIVIIDVNLVKHQVKKKFYYKVFLKIISLKTLRLTLCDTCIFIVFKYI